MPKRRKANLEDSFSSTQVKRIGSQKSSKQSLSNRKTGNEIGIKNLWEIESVLRRRVRYSQIDYEIKWTEFSKNTWEPRKILMEDAKNYVKNFELKYYRNRFAELSSKQNSAKQSKKVDQSFIKKCDFPRSAAKNDCKIVLSGVVPQDINTNLNNNGCDTHNSNCFNDKFTEHCSQNNCVSSQALNQQKMRLVGNISFNNQNCSSNGNNIKSISICNDDIKTDDSDVIIIESKSSTSTLNHYNTNKFSHLNIGDSKKAFKDNVKTSLFYDQACTRHFGNLDEPESPERYKACIDRLFAENLVKRCHRLNISDKATDDEILEAHSQYLLGELSTIDDRVGKENHGYFSSRGDSYYECQFTLDCVRLSAKAAIEMTKNVQKGDCDNGFCLIRPPGHHCNRFRRYGFCHVNNVAIAAMALLKQNPDIRITILDWDLHHGNGTQEIFYKHDNVLYISIHQEFDDNEEYMFPATGALTEIGDREARGKTVNLPIPRGCGNSEYRTLLDRIILPIMGEFKTNIVLVSSGFDSARGDPLGALEISPEMFGYMTRQLMTSNMLMDSCKGKVVLFLEGGYNPDVVAKCVTKCVGSLLGDEITYMPKDSKEFDFLYHYVDKFVMTHRRYQPCLFNKQRISDIVPLICSNKKKKKIKKEKLNVLRRSLSHKQLKKSIQESESDIENDFKYTSLSSSSEEEKDDDAFVPEEFYSSKSKSKTSNHKKSHKPSNNKHHKHKDNLQKLNTTGINQINMKRKNSETSNLNNKKAFLSPNLLASIPPPSNPKPLSNNLTDFDTNNMSSINVTSSAETLKMFEKFENYYRNEIDHEFNINSNNSLNFRNSHVPTYLETNQNIFNSNQNNFNSIAIEPNTILKQCSSTNNVSYQDSSTRLMPKNTDIKPPNLNNLRPPATSPPHFSTQALVDNFNTNSTAIESDSESDYSSSSVVEILLNFPGVEQENPKIHILESKNPNLDSENNNLNDNFVSASSDKNNSDTKLNNSENSDSKIPVLVIE